MKKNKVTMTVKIDREKYEEQIRKKTEAVIQRGVERGASSREIADELAQLWVGSGWAAAVAAAEIRRAMGATTGV